MKNYKAIIVALSMLLPITAQATLVTYTDRATFEAALASFSTDNFTGIPSGGLTSIDRGDYSIASPGMYGCVNTPGACGP